MEKSALSASEIFWMQSLLIFFQVHTHTHSHIYIYMCLCILGAASKKVVLLGGAHHKVAHPPPSPVVVKVPLFLGDFFCLESPDTEK